MDYANQDLGNSSQSVEINPAISSYLEETRKWMTFLAVLGYICVGFLILAGLFMSLIPSDSLMNANMPFKARYVGILYLSLGIVYLFPLNYMMRFSSSIKNALLMRDNDLLTKAFKNLRSLFKFVGILAIVGILFYVIMIITLVIMGVAQIF